jgi:hypothetical protein
MLRINLYYRRIVLLRGLSGLRDGDVFLLAQK